MHLQVLSPGSEGIETTKEILRSLIVAQRSPSIFELALIADLPENERNDEEAIMSHITRCGAFVTVSEDEYQSVSFIDAAAREHLETYAKEELSLSLNDVQHGIVALRCLDYVRSTFRKQDISEAPAQDQIAEPDSELQNAPAPESNMLENGQDGLSVNQEDLPTNETEADSGEDPSHAGEVNKIQEDTAQQGEQVEPEPDNEDNETSISDDADVDPAMLDYPCAFWLEHAKEAPLDLVDELDLDDEFWGEDSSARDAWWSANGGFAGTSNTTPLHFAASSGYLALVGHLLDKGRLDDINKIDSWSYQPLDWACYYGHLDVAQRLVKAGANVNNHTEDGEVCPIWLAALSSHVDIVEYLLAHGAETDIQDDSLGTPLYAASENGCVPIVRQLLERTSNINLAGGLHRRPLNVAAYCGHIDTVKLLLANNPDVDPDEEYQYGSALGAAARKGHDEIVRLLLERGWNANRKMRSYYSPLVVAATYGHLEVVKALLKHRTDSKSRELALEGASKNGKADIVKILLEQSHSIPHVKAFINAASHGRDNVLRLLEPCGTHPEMLSTAIYQASDAEHESTVELLLEFGADPDAEGPE